MKQAFSKLLTSYDNKLLLLLVFGTFFLKLILYPWAQVIDADAVSRIFMAREWWEHPKFITEGVWLPLHEYLFGIVVGISNDLIHTPIVVNLFLSSLTAIPLYHFTRREFNAQAAPWVALAFVLNPVIFHNGYHTLSGTPFLLFTALAMNSFSKGLTDNQQRDFVHAGLYMTIASGFRYEGWIIIAVFAAIGLVHKQVRNTTIFGLIAALFPLFWMIGNYSAHGHLLYGIPGVYNSDVVAEAEQHVQHDYELLRLFFFPASWFVLFSPILVFGLMYAFFVNLRKRMLSWKHLRWAIPFVLLLCMFTYKSHHGTLLTQHRFSSVLMLFSVPFLAWLWDAHQKQFLRFIAMVGIVSLLPLSYYWTTVPVEGFFAKNSSTYYALKNFRNISNATMTAVPRLQDQECAAIGKRLAHEDLSGKGLMIDYSSWQEAYYLVLHSEVHPEQFHVVGQDKLSEAEKEQLRTTLKKYPTGYWIRFKGKSDVPMFISEESVMVRGRVFARIKFKPVQSFARFEIFRYNLVTLIQ